MAKRESFLLRIDPVVLEAIRRWSDDEMRSMNAQIEFILRSTLKEAGRLPQKSKTVESNPVTSAMSKPKSSHHATTPKSARE